jgi:hypothetical protein
VSIEAGASTALELYREPALVDEVWLSAYLEPWLHEDVHGDSFLSVAELDARFAGRPAAVVQQESGRWAFRRLVRREPRPQGGRKAAAAPPLDAAHFHPGT